MHRLRSNHAIYRFRISALLLCAKCVLIPVVAVMLCHSIIVHDDFLTILAMGGIALCVLIVVLQWVVSARTNCPLCMTPVLANKDCVKSRNARKFLGSYRLRVALSLLFKNTFRCPYCNEPTALEVRHTHHYQPYSKG